MENKANRQEQAKGYLLFAIGIFLWASIFLAFFGAWSWVLAGVYAINAGLFASCIFKEHPLMKRILLFVVIEALQIVTCTVILGLF